MALRNLDDPLMREACVIYGFAVIPDPHTLSTRQMELLGSIAAALGKRDSEITRLRNLCSQANIDVDLVD